ncbi:MAG: bifunctional UDP-N-acetylglucosamine diphosphorylase/glucosamine-1-phosphate N-acetyltransferase GlmU, partial [Atopostipes suicloacalis]|nr:bifunctional UDP-N-acetylglucosamine diphosphorylase/glucosamine-1-phosphate N-acetyltransferase GlmU [Atopostipes suicloacalis]
MKNRYVIVLAAGQGTRMKSKLYKVMHPVMGKAMVEHVVQSAIDAEVKKVFTVIGVGSESVKDCLKTKSDYVYQKEQLGTAHAVEQARSFLEDEEGTTLVLSGDAPLVQAETIKKLMDFHEDKKAQATVLTSLVDKPFGYGRIIRSEDGSVHKIVEEKDASSDEKKTKEINTGTYCFNNKKLFEILNKVDNDNAQGEYYLPDVIEILKEENEVVEAYQLENRDESLGVNNRVALSKAQEMMQKRINEKHMQNGVTIIDPKNTYIEVDVKIGQDTIIEPGSYLKGNTSIGEDVIIGSNTQIIDSEIEDKVKVRESVIEESTVKKGSDVGPYSHLRPNTVIESKVHIGNFVEVKNSIIRSETSVGHHSYIGDAEIGEKTNIGAGIVFANYDGKGKHKTFVGANSFVGSNVTLVAPVRLGEKSFVAAGSTITDDVPAGSLGLGRGRQVIKEDFYSNYFNKKSIEDKKQKTE